MEAIGKGKYGVFSKSLKIELDNNNIIMSDLDSGKLKSQIPINEIVAVKIIHRTIVTNGVLIIKYKETNYTVSWYDKKQDGAFQAIYDALTSQQRKKSDDIDEPKVQAGEMVKMLTLIEHSDANLVTPVSQVSPKSSVVDELTKLADLKADGVITNGEFEQLKKDLLSKGNHRQEFGQINESKKLDAGPVLEEGVEDQHPNSVDKGVSLKINSTTIWKNKGNAPDDLGEYDRAIEVNPQDAEAWRNKGIALHRLGKFDEAITAYDKAIEINPQDADAWGNKGAALDDLGKFDQATIAHDKATEINPQDVAAWSNKGLNLYHRGNYDEATLALDMAIELDPKSTPAWNAKGSVLVGQGKYDEGIQAFDKAIQLDPLYAAAWNNKGGVLVGQGKYDEAIQAFDKTIEINPQDANYWNSKCIALFKHSKYDEALIAVNKAIELDPNLEEAQTAKRLILRKLGNFKTEDAVDWFSKGVSLHQKGEYDEAIRAYDKAIELDPTLAIEVQKAKNLIIKTPSVIEFDTCPVCKTGRLLVTDRKKFLGLITDHDVICNNYGCRWKMLDQHVKEFMATWEHQKNIAVDTWLADIRRGQGFPIENNPPIMLKKNETSIFTLNNISMSENRSVRTGHYSGSRVRVAKGVSIGGGTFRSQSHEELTEIDKGTLTLTNQRLIFVGQTHSSDIPLKKIISIEPFSNAIVVGKEGRAKTQQFTGTDKSSFNISVEGRTWTIPIHGVIIQTMIERLTG